MNISYKSFVKSESNGFIRKVKFIYWLNQELKKLGLTRNQIILVGGLAVELYTGGVYSTMDIDLLSSDTRKIDSILFANGFKKDQGSRYWYNDEDDLVVESPDYIDGMEKVVDVEFDFGTIPVLSPESIIIDRICAYKFWNRNKDDYNWAKLILETYIKDEGNFDITYLYQKAEEEDVVDIVDKMIEEINNGI